MFVSVMTCNEAVVDQQLPCSARENDAFVK